MEFSFAAVHPSWQPIVQEALQYVDKTYLNTLKNTTDWLPGPTQIFNAFSIPFDQTRYILLGESPYPRPDSANGYAFWDNRVEALWSDQGMTKLVNRATSLRNIMKMLLVANHHLPPSQLSQAAIAQLDKTHFIQTGRELFEKLLKHGFLLLNASLVLSPKNVQEDAKHWRPFMAKLLELISQKNDQVQLILFGKIANLIEALPAAQKFSKVYAEHPYNLSFIQNPKVLDFFRSFHLLEV